MLSSRRVGFVSGSGLRLLQKNQTVLRTRPLMAAVCRSESSSIMRTGWPLAPADLGRRDVPSPAADAWLRACEVRDYHAGPEGGAFAARTARRRSLGLKFRVYGFGL